MVDFVISSILVLGFIEVIVVIEVDEVVEVVGVFQVALRKWQLA